MERSKLLAGYRTKSHRFGLPNTPHGSSSKLGKTEGCVKSRFRVHRIYTIFFSVPIRNMELEMNPHATGTGSFARRRCDQERSLPSMSSAVGFCGGEEGGWVPNHQVQTWFQHKVMLVSSRVFATRHLASARAFSKLAIRIGTDDPRMSRIVVHNGVVYISGQTDTASSDIRGQTKKVLAKVDDLLSQAGTSKSNLLTASIWLKDISTDFKPMNEVWCEWLDPENKPVRATVQAPMARPQILVEIQVTAAKYE